MGQKKGCAGLYGNRSPKDDFGFLWQLRSISIKGNNGINLNESL